MAFDPSIINFLTVNNFSDSSYGIPASQQLVAADDTGLIFSNAGPGSTFTLGLNGNLLNLMNLQNDTSYGIMISVPQIAGGIITRELVGNSTISITGGTGASGNPTIGVNPSTTLQLIATQVGGTSTGSAHSTLNIIAGSNIGISGIDTGTTTEVTISATIPGSIGLLAGANAWTGTNTYNVNLPTSTLTPTLSTELITKAYGDATYATISGEGTVTSVAASSSTSTISISGSPITTSGTLNLNLPLTAVTAGTYTNANLTVDAYGRLTDATSGSVSATVSTTDETLTTLATIPVSTDTAITISGTVVGRNTSGTINNTTGGKYIVTAINTAGTVSLAATAEVVVQSTSTGTFNVIVSGSNLILQVTGINATDYTWSTTYSTISI